VDSSPSRREQPSSAGAPRAVEGDDVSQRRASSGPSADLETREASASRASARQPLSPEQHASEEKVLRERFAEVAKSPFGLPGSGPAAAKIVDSVRALGPAGVSMVLEQLDSEEPRNRVAAAQVAGRVNDPDAIPALIDTALNDPDEQVAAGASQALALMDIPDTRREEVVVALGTLAETPNGVASELNSIYNLVRLGAPEGVPLALSYLEDPDQVAQAKALLATNLATLGLPSLLPVMDLAVSMFADSPLPVVATIIGYYQLVGATDRLQAIAQNQAIPSDVRQQAVLAANVVASAEGL
jgi:HEAT repeats